MKKLTIAACAFPGFSCSIRPVQPKSFVFTVPGTRCQP